MTFTERFDFYPAARKGYVCVAYKQGMTRNVTRECAEKARALGVAKGAKARGRPSVGSGKSEAREKAMKHDKKTGRR